MHADQALEEARLLDFARRLIQTPSLSLEEEAISRVIEAEMKDLGYDEVWRDSLHNVVGVLNGPEPGPTLMFNGHIDHAGVGEMADPFSGDLRDGAPYGHPGSEVIYGRGACDMKGAVAAMIQAGGAAKKAGLPRQGKVLVTCVSREEMARGEGIKALLDSGLTADMAVSGEASGLQVYLGHRGKFECQVTTRGRTTHGGNPAGGINAIFKMNRLLAALQEDYPLPDHDFLGAATLTVLDIAASPGALTPIVPDRCWAVVDRRFLPHETQESLLAGINELLGQLHQEDPEFQASVEPLKWFPAMFTDPDQPVVQAMQRARQKMLGSAGPLGAWYFGVDGTFINQAGIPTVGLGPGNEYLAHTPQDVVPVDQLQDAARVYRAMIQEVCG